MHDPITYNHSGQVSNVAGYLAKESGLSKPETRLVYQGGWFHDVGKLFVPAEVINREHAFYLTKSQNTLLVSHGKKGALISRMLNLSIDFEQIADQHWMGETEKDPTTEDLEQRNKHVPFITIADLVASAFDKNRKHQPDYTEEDVVNFMYERFEKGIFPAYIKPAFDKLMTNGNYKKVIAEPFRM